MNYFVESKRCKYIRRVLIALFVVCGYLLSTTYAIDVVEVNGEQVLSYMTALNLAFGTLGGEIPVYTNKIAIIFFIIPLVGFLFMMFDKKSNVKNIVGMICGIIGALSISFMIGVNIGMGSMVSVLLYFIITVLSAFAALFHRQDKTNSKETKRLSVHE
ncbi:MAG: hypothetical protein K2M82_04610 [Lachnospiraceae bacterium]|nr:hypothetical protein [Lachnospiraceae bacterium]